MDLDDSKTPRVVLHADSDALNRFRVFQYLGLFSRRDAIPDQYGRILSKKLTFSIRFPLEFYGEFDWLKNPSGSFAC